jgi:hypothetical protein
LPAAAHAVLPERAGHSLPATDSVLPQPRRDLSDPHPDLPAAADPVLPVGACLPVRVRLPARRWRRTVHVNVIAQLPPRRELRRGGVRPQSPDRPLEAGDSMPFRR